MKKGKARKMKFTRARDIHQLSVPDIIKCVPRWVENDFLSTVEMYKDDKDITSADILIEMMQDKYLREFPKSAQRAVKDKISSMMNKRLLMALDDVVEIECKKRNMSKGDVIEQIKKSDDFVKCIFPDANIPKDFKERMQETVDGYVKGIEEQINPKTDTAEIDIAEKDNLKEEVIESDTTVKEEVTKPEEIEKSGEAEYNFEEIDKSESKDQTIDAPELLKNDENKEMSDEEKFVEAVRLFTNNYEFLADDVKFYLANKGHRDSQLAKQYVNGENNVIVEHKPHTHTKFKSVEDAMRFLRIQELVRKMMPDDVIDEEKALKRIIVSLDDKDVNENKKLKSQSGYAKTIKKTKINNAIKDLGVDKEEAEFIKSVLAPICESRLEEINRQKKLKREEVDR